MVKHIVMWNLIEGSRGKTKEENIQDFRQQAKNLMGKIDGLLSMEVYEGYQGRDVILISDFADQEACAAYQPHPLHMELKKLGAQLFTDRADIDYEY